MKKMSNKCNKSALKCTKSMQQIFNQLESLEKKEKGEKLNYE